MKTISIGIQNLYAPCSCSCKYCLLQSCRKAEGVDYYRGKRFAEKFVAWAKRNNINPLPYYSIAYCADYPELIDNILFNKSIEFAGATFLQCNGIKRKNLEEMEQFIKSIKKAGIKNIDITFFGTRNYHDLFAGRQGDYDFMIQLANCVTAHDVHCSPTIVINKENITMLDNLFYTLNSIPKIGKIHSFLPDYRGRGYLMESARITSEDYISLSDKIKDTFNINRYKTQKEWLEMDFLPEYTQRSLVITLRKDNIDMLENMSCNEIVEYVEKLDDDYYAAIPSINELAKMYGDKENLQLYRLRDLFWKWQMHYIEENSIDIYNVTDERLCHTVRS